MSDKDFEKAFHDSVLYGEGFVKVSWDGEQIKMEYLPSFPEPKRPRFRYREVFVKPKKKWWQWWK